MPKRTDIKSIAIIGAGPIVIGQACEFDYSGVQACKALREEGYRVILVNSNPATIMTDPNLADATYIEPITPATVAKILEKERPDALLPTMGGQTALNTAMALDDDGTLARLGIEMIGANKQVIAKAEDRLLFRDAMDKIGLESPRSRMVRSFDEALAALAEAGLPSIIRPSFTLAGTGGGIAYNSAEFEEIVRGGLRASPTHEVLIEELVLGWKEYEMEVVRDRADNCIIVCSIENLDPMGVHTGDSITVAPALTLTDKEYQIMRNASIAVLREIGVDTGGSNVQFAVNPADGRMVVIEMNPRVWRSSALASKATGFPIAKIAAKLAVGYPLDELDNDITGVTPASFEPTIDYVVTKMPRFTFEKFPGAEPLLTTSMKSVGEAMSIGRTFAESVQKALRSMETGLTGFNEVLIGDGNPDPLTVRAALSKPTPDRLLVIAQAFRHGLSVAEIQAACKYDPWFLEQIQAIVAAEAEVRAKRPADRGAGLAAAEADGFCDARLAELAGTSEAEVSARAAGAGRHAGLQAHRHLRRRVRVGHALHVFDLRGRRLRRGGVRGRADRPEQGRDPGRRAQPHRPGHRVRLLLRPRRLCADRGRVRDHHGQLQPGDRLDRLRHLRPALFRAADRRGRDRDGPGRAEQGRSAGRHRPVRRPDAAQAGARRWKRPASRSSAPRPTRSTWPRTASGSSSCCTGSACASRRTALARSLEEAEAVAPEIGYPVVIRPSYVLGGRAMEIVHDMAGLQPLHGPAVKVSGQEPGADRPLSAERDRGRCRRRRRRRRGLCRRHHGAHRGGRHPFRRQRLLAAALLAGADVVAEIERQTSALARALDVVGLMNVQFAVKDGEVYVLEVNPRASRTVPFVAKATGVPIAKIAARVMAGEKLAAASPLERPRSPPATSRSRRRCSRSTASPAST